MKRHGILPRWLVPLCILALCGYLFLMRIGCQVTISSRQQQLSEMQTQLVTIKAENAELRRILDEVEDAIIERIAREQDYAKPNERIFIDISGK